jgi:hypothetical protein
MPGRESMTGRRAAGSRRAQSHGPRAVLAGVVAAGVVLLVAGCTSTALPTESLSTAMSTEPLEVAADSAGAAAEVAPQMGGSAPATGGDAAQTAAAAQPPTISAVPPTGRQVILTATVAVTLTVPPVAVTDDSAKDAQGNTDARREAVAQASGAVRGAATAAGGYVSGADGGGSTMTITLRVPAEQYDAVVDRVAALGVLNSRSENSQDVTAEIVDVNSRVESMTASVARVRALLAQATGIGDVIAIESELASREADLESLQRQQASLAGLVALSTVTVTLTAVTDGPTALPADSPSGFVTGLTSGWNALLGSLAVIGTVVGALLPFLPVVATLVVAGWWMVRRARRRSREQAMPAEAAADEVRPPESVGASTA